MRIQKKIGIIFFLIFMFFEIMEMHVYAADFDVTIPKTIVLDESKQSMYSVKVNGTIASNETVIVQPSNNTFLMKDQSKENKKKDVSASISSGKTEWDSTDVTNSVISENNKVYAQSLSAGNWKGTFAFEIKVNKNLSLATDGDVSVEVGSTIQTNAYLNDEVVNNAVSWESNNENIIVKDGMISLSDKATAGDEATISVTYIDDKTGKELRASFKVTVIGNKYGNVIGRTGYCGADTSYEAVKFAYPTDLYADGTILNGARDTCYTNAYFTYYSDTKTLVISGVGEFMAGKASVKRDNTYKMTLPRTGYGDLYKEVEHLVIEDGITNVAQEAFYNFSELKDVDFGNTVKKIEEFAFIYDTSLTEIVLPDSLITIENSPFHVCSGIKTLTIGTGVKYLGSLGYMENCEKVYYNAINAECTKDSVAGNYYGTFTYLGKNVAGGVELYIGSEVQKIPDNFSNISTGNYNSDSNRSPNWGKIVFSNDGRLKEIGVMAFINQLSSRFNLKSIELPDGLEVIGDKAFWNQRGLIDVELPDSLTTIGKSAFAGCISLEEIELPDTLTTIDSGAFGGCHLNSLYIPASVTSIKINGDRKAAPFYGCNFTTIYCGTDKKQEGWETNWNTCYDNSGSVKYYNVVYGTDRDNYKNYYGAKEIVLSDSTTTIINKQFENFKNLETIYIPSVLTY